ncbi:MAG: hypothetical protein KDC76_14335 [Bacteroidetes bacterium]|nr:hypothetical protein [Bacteroidota bacterium]
MPRYLTRLFLLLIPVLIFSCRDDESIFTGSNATLVSRADTVYFDTVFTAQSPGIPKSVNKQFTVINPYKQIVHTSFDVMGGKSSFFRINVDGEVGPSVKDLEILPGDSVFVFVEVSVDPNYDRNTMPLIVRDSIRMVTNGSAQYVQLRAWGQDAHYFLADTLCDVVLDDQLKPYVVHSYLYVPENCTLTIKEGVRMHFAPRAWLYVEGTLKIEGTKDKPVFFEGDRLEPDYEEEPGQWGGIWLNYLSGNNEITHARIKNGTVGIYCDSSLRAGAGNWNVLVQNTEVRNMSFDGLSGKGSTIRAVNSVFDNCGRYSFLGLWGGEYQLYQCDFMTYGYRFSRREPTFVLNNVETDEFGSILRIFDINFDVRNCIIDGNRSEEVGFGLIDDQVNPARIFDYNLLKTEQKLDANGLKNVKVEVINNKPRQVFEDYRAYNYQLDTFSQAVNMGFNLGIDKDLIGNNRVGAPDAGAYERQQ